MHKKLDIVISVVGTVVLAVALPARAQGSRPGPCSTNVNVTTTVADTDISSSNPFQFQSDGQGPYKTYSNFRTDSVTSEIQVNSCDWLFDTTNSASRAVAVTLLFPASTPLSPPPFTNATLVRSRIISRCGQNALNSGISYGSMTFAGQTLQCQLSIGDIPYNGNTYAVRFNPNNYAGTTWTQVTCTGAVSSVCNSWTVTPISNSGTNPLGEVTAIGELVQLSTIKGQTVVTPMGLYYVAFDVTIHK